jgi:RNA polymerase sigma-70 factor (ECF subfamily)
VGLEPSVSDDASDAAVIAHSSSRPEAFAAIFDRHFGAVHGYLARRIGGGRADDLASATFTVAFERRRKFHSDADSARPWLYGIATNLLRNERRSEQRAIAALPRMRPVEAERAAAEGVHTARLATLLGELDADQRDVLLLYAWAELPYEEIASSLGIPIGTVRSRLARARAHLRAGLTSDGEAAPTRDADAQERSG